ncbi:LamG domain-containing protein, partial [Microseira wollei]|uniref:LamG domain-containing protein n=1 Tax=Microseira wollei TaxID=467598 RepID=UPI001CFCFC27
MTILTKEKLQHLNSITHEGKVVVLATDGDGKIWYTVKQDGFEDSYLNQPAESRTGWESWQQLEFPDEPNDISVINKETAELTYKSDTTKFVIKSRYRTKEITAVAPVQLVSALGHIYVFRQSTTNTLLVDRFVLDGMTNTLNRKLEVRFKRSRQKHEPTKNMNKGSNGLVNIDSLDFRDANGLPFYEPTTELCAIGNLQKGWFAVVLVPTIESDVYRWHIFAYNSQTQKVELTTLRASDEGLFEVKDYTIWEDSDKGLLPRSIAGVIKRTLEIGSVTINNGLAATKYDLQQSQMTQSGEEQLLKTATRLMLAVPTTTGTAALSFAIAADGTLAQIDETPEKTIIRSNQREVLLPLNTLDEIKAFGDRTPTPQGIIVGLLEGTKAENAEDLVKVSTNSQAAGLADGDLVKISGTKDYQGLYNTRRIDANTFEISIATGTELGYWEKEEEEEGGLIFDGMITAYEKTADGKLKVSCPNHGLEDGDQVQIYGTQAYNDTYPVKKIDDTHFVIERKWATGEAVNVRLVALKRRGIVFDGVDDYVEIPYSAELNPKQFTVSCWAKVTGGQGTYRSLVTSRDINTSNNTFGYIIYAGENNKWQLWVGNNTQNWTIVTGSDIVLNQWTHIAATFDGSKAKLYINGVFAAEVAANYTGNTARPLRIGTGKTEGTAQQFFSGQIADVLIWNLARTEADIKNSMYLQLTGKETGLVGYWRLGGISEGKVVDFSVNGNDGKVYSDPYVGAMTLNRKLGDNTTDAVKYSNSELFAVSQRAIYEESFEFKVNSPTAVNLAYLNNADGRNLGNKIFTLSYWGKTSRSAEEKKPITTFVQNVFEDVGGGWFRVSANVTIPDGVSMLRSFEINDIKGTWTSLEIRKHRIRLLSDSITEAKYTDSVTLTTLADAYAQLPQQLRTLEFKEQQEFSILKEKRELEDKIALISSGNLSALVAAQQTKVNGLLATKNEKFAIYQNELNSPFNYYCQIKLPNDQMPKQDGKPYLQAQGGTENVVRWSSGQNWQFIDQG